MTDPLLARLTYEPVTVELEPIPWPAGLVPTPVETHADPTTPLPQADVLVVTWTGAEWKALADVLTPGQPTTRWAKYAEHWEDYESQLTDRSPARDAGCMAEYQLTKIGDQRVLCVHSQLHLCTDAISAPIVQLWRQMVHEVLPSLVITTGTAGGIGTDTQVGDVFVASNAKFNCTKDFKYKRWCQERFTGTPITAGSAVSQWPVLAAVNGHRLSPIADRLPLLTFGGSVETVDYFGFADTNDSYGIVANDPTAHTEEMDDATLPLALSDLAGGLEPGWVSIRNASDPQVLSSIGDLEAQSKWASQIYERYGFYATIGSAIACWAVIADLP